MHFKSIRLMRLFLLGFFCVLFCLQPIAHLRSAEDIGGLMVQGDEALARGDYEQALLIGNRIVTQDPRNLSGYRLALICCVMKNWAHTELLNEIDQRLHFLKLDYILGTGTRLGRFLIVFSHVS